MRIQPESPWLFVDLPRRVVVGANGAYWRDFGAHYSMCPTSDDNDPIDIVAVYELVESRRDDRAAVAEATAVAIKDAL